MYRQSPSRNQRSKGIKVKHALQICLLLAVCFWLIYQVKHSHYKKNEFVESNAKASLQRGSSGGFLKPGRKVIHPRVQETMTKHEQHDEAAEEEETTDEEVEENKREGERPEDRKAEEDNEGMRDGDDEIDEHELEKLDTEVDREEDFVDDQREDGVENETEGKNSDDGNGQMEKESFVEETDRDGDDRGNHEALEELYKADDASSAVAHDTHIETTENGNERVENSNEHPENILEQENKENKIEETNNGEIRKQLQVEIGEMAKDDHLTNVTDDETNATTSETKENNLEYSKNGSTPNNMLTVVSNDNLETSYSTTEVIRRNPNLSLQNVAESDSELDHGSGIVNEGTSAEGSNLQTSTLEQPNNSTLDVENNLLDSNSTGHAEYKDAESNFEEFSNPSNYTDLSALVRITRSENFMEAGINTESATEKNEATKSVKSDIRDGTDEVLESAITENPESQIDS